MSLVRALIQKKAEKEKKERVVCDDRCEFIVKGVRCPRRSTKKHYCDVHDEPGKPEPSPRDCSICIDKKTKFKWFYCTHGVCIECLLQLRAMVCPICRDPIENVLTAFERKTLEKNIQHDRDERIREEQRNLRQSAAQHHRHDRDDDDESSDDDDEYEARLVEFLRESGMSAGDIRNEQRRTRSSRHLDSFIQPFVNPQLQHHSQLLFGFDPIQLFDVTGRGRGVGGGRGRLM